MVIRSYIALAIIAVVAVGATTVFAVKVAIDKVVQENSHYAAQEWSSYLVQAMPDLDSIVAGRDLSPHQWRAVEAAQNVGGVFRFKIFNLKGQQVFVSDDPSFHFSDTEPEISTGALEAIKTGNGEIELEDNSEHPERPPVYVEAYMPVHGDRGETKAVVEVYVDQTPLHGLLTGTFTALALGLAALSGLAMGIPAAAFIRRSIQVERQKSRAEYLAHYDQLTGLLNRGALHERLNSSFADKTPNLSLVFFDVDRFKSINDSYGHEFGDDYLLHVTKALKQGAGSEPGALISRIGGDEFVVAFFDTPTHRVHAFVDSVLTAARAPATSRSRTIMGSVSAGVHHSPPEEDRTDALHRADIALYQAKLDGGNCQRTYSSDIEKEIAERREVERLLRDALLNRTLELNFQPLFEARGQSCIGFEALLRLRDESGAQVPPSRFIPIAEDTGLIVPIGEWVLEEAMATAATWPNELFVAVNLSARQFADGKLVETVDRLLQQTGLATHRLELEVTESMLMQNTDSIVEQLQELGAMGVSIAMDDFGTGYSSLGYLWQFGFDKLKIDRSFVNALDVNDERAKDILDTIILLGHKLNMTVTAEGIETDSQAQVLQALHCDQLQGFLFGRPGPAASLDTFIRPETQVEAVAS